MGVITTFLVTVILLVGVGSMLTGTKQYREDNKL